MAEIFWDDSRLSEHVAKLPGTQAHLDKEIGKRAAKARRRLAAHRHDGHAEIEVAAGDADRYLILSDDRGQRAAMSIEFGRKAGADGKGGMRGLFILHEAMDRRYSR